MRLIDILDNIGIVLGIVTPIVSVLAWINTRRLLKRRVGIGRPTAGNNDVALVYALSTNMDIVAQVKQYLVGIDGLAGLVNGNKLNTYREFPNLSQDGFTVNYTMVDSGRIIDIRRNDLQETEVDNYMAAFHDLNESLLNLLRRNGVQRIHLFFAGPSPLAAIMGSKLSNQFSVSVYHYSRERSTYFSLGDLRPIRQNQVKD